MLVQIRFKVAFLLILSILGRTTWAFLQLSLLLQPSPWHPCVVVSLPTGRSSATLLFDSVSSTSTTSIQQREILRPLILVDEETGDILAQGHELQSLAEERDKPDEDELEMLYPTQRQYFQFGDSSMHIVQMVRTTSFGCGKLGHQVWPSAVALSLALVHEYRNASIDATHRPRSVLELGAGCGLPSVVCRDVLQLPLVTATDFWYDDQTTAATRDWDRLIPEIHHGINLNYNVGMAAAAGAHVRGEERQKTTTTARVQCLDWHDIESVRRLEPVDLVIGSDVIYYPMDMGPLWKTMETLLKDGGATKVILMLPLKPDTREALPAFLELLENKSSSDASEFLLERQGLYLYTSREDLEAREEGAHFLKLSLSLRK